MSGPLTDLTIIGGSFAGLACARSAALRGLNVQVIERKPQPGFKVHTTGLLVKEVAEEWEVPLHLTRKIHGVRLYAPSLKSIDLTSPGYYFLATDTAGLLEWSAKETKAVGVSLRLNQSFTGAEWVGNHFILADDLARTRYLVGADGPSSRVAHCFGLGLNRHFLLGVEAEWVGVKGVQEDYLHCFLDSALAPGYIAWVIPGVGGVTQIGLACQRPYKPRLDLLLEKIRPLFDFSQAKMLSKRGGLIPVGGRVKPFAAKNVLLVGDAAGVVSPLTAGGIHTALDSGWRAAHAIADYLLDNGPDPARVLPAVFPRFVNKRLLRLLLNQNPPNWLFNVGLASPPLRALAKLVYFHKRGLFSKEVWRELVSFKG